MRTSTELSLRTDDYSVPGKAPAWSTGTSQNQHETVKSTVFVQMSK